MREVASLGAEAGKRSRTRNDATANYRARILSDVRGGEIGRRTRVVRAVHVERNVERRKRVRSVRTEGSTSRNASRFPASRIEFFNN